MLDDLNARDGEGTSGRERPVRAPEFAQPLADREVPLNAVTNADDVLNRWLDGEGPEPVAMRGDAARHVDFWKSMNEETGRRRQMVTPAHIQARIMEALPGAAMSHAEPWYKRELHVNAATALAAAAGLLALGAALVSLAN